MDGIILTLLDYLSDADKIRLLSTCRTFWELRFQIRLVERYEYVHIQNTSYINSFVNVWADVTEPTPIHPCIREVHYKINTVNSIPDTVKIVHITQHCKTICLIPYTVEELHISHFYDIIRIQDGDNEITTIYSAHVNFKMDDIICRDRGGVKSLRIVYHKYKSRIMGGSAVLRYSN
jgi:hypothetical protein